MYKSQKKKVLKLFKEICFLKKICLTTSKNKNSENNIILYSPIKYQISK